MEDTLFDVIVVGAGFSGLYSAFLLKKENPSLKIKILEKSARLGGRAGYHNFHGTKVMIGAGVGRYAKDHRLRSLATKLGVQYKRTIVSIDHNIKGGSEAFQRLLKKLKLVSPTENETFEAYARRALGPKDAAHLIELIGYKDYLKAAACHTTKCYGLEDTLPGWEAMYIPWDELSNKLAEGQDIEKKVCVSKVERAADAFKVTLASDNEVMYSRMLLLATPMKPLLRILPSENTRILSQSVGWSPFLRVYGKLDERSSQMMPKHYTVVEGNLKKIIPIRPDKGVFMIAYTDNDHARVLRPHAMKKDTVFFARELQKALRLKETPVIEDIWHKWWESGTHFYKPRDKLFPINTIRFPFGGDVSCAIVGESVAACNQGWVEGALESAESVFKTFKKKGFLGV